jgi:hypothetical protein
VAVGTVQVGVKDIVGVGVSVMVGVAVFAVKLAETGMVRLRVQPTNRTAPARRIPTKPTVRPSKEFMNSPKKELTAPNDRLMRFKEYLIIVLERVILFHESTKFTKKALRIWYVVSGNSGIKGLFCWIKRFFNIQEVAESANYSKFLICPLSAIYSLIFRAHPRCSVPR